MIAGAAPPKVFRLRDLQSWSVAVPTNNRRPMMIAVTVLMLVLGFGGLWAATAPLGGAVIVSGRVVAQGRNIAVQNLEGGILARMLATEGQKVTKGELLAEMDTTSVISQLQRVLVDRATAMIELARWRAERDNTDFKPDLGELGKSADEARIRDAFDSQNAEFISGRQAFAQRLRALDGKIANEEEDLIYLASQRSQTASQITLIGNERSNLGTLQEKGLIANSRILSLDRELSKLEAEKSNVSATLEKSRNNISALQDEKEQIQFEREVRINENLTEVQKRLNANEDQVTRLKDILRRSKLTSPVNGVIVSVPAKSVGAVIQPGQTLIELLPSDVGLELEVPIFPKDIDDIYVDQPVEIVFPSDQSNVRPPLSGSVTYVSADAFLDSSREDIRYISRVGMNADWNGRTILPGMTGEVFFQTQSRTLLELLLEPITRFAQRTFED